MAPDVTFAGTVFSLWGRVFAFLAAGYLIGRVAPRDLGPWVRGVVGLSLHALVPLFVFTLLWGGAMPWGRFGALSMAVAGVLAAGTAMAWGFARSAGAPFREVCLPIVFMNSVFLALPVNTLLFGERGAAATLVFNLIVTAAHFTMGLRWVGGAAAWKETFRIPVVPAGLLGAALDLAGAPCPGPVAAFSRFLSTAALPAMLVVVGIRMAGVPAADWRRAGGGVVLRLGGGALAGWALSAALGLSGAERGAVVLTAAMPTALNAYLLAEKFEANPGFAAAMVTAGTALSALTIPLLGWWLR